MGLDSATSRGLSTRRRELVEGMIRGVLTLLRELVKGIGSSLSASAEAYDVQGESEDCS